MANFLRVKSFHYQRDSSLSCFPSGSTPCMSPLHHLEIAFLLPSLKSKLTPALPPLSSVCPYTPCCTDSVLGFSLCRLNQSIPTRDHICTVTLSSPTTPGRASFQTGAWLQLHGQLHTGSKACPCQLCQESIISCLHPNINKQPPTASFTQLLEIPVCLGVVGTRSQINALWEKLRQKKTTNYILLRFSLLSSSLYHTPLHVILRFFLIVCSFYIYVIYKYFEISAAGVSAFLA